MDAQRTSRRERLRAETAAEIKAIARALLAGGGPDAISLRAIAREMGMTPNAIYSYYATRDDLITSLITDIYTSLQEALEGARDAVPVEDKAGRFLAWTSTCRRWSLANPEGFRLIYGDPVPGYLPPVGGPAAEANHRICAGHAGLVAAAWPEAAPLQPPSDDDWSDFDHDFVTRARREHPDLPPAGLALALRIWGRLHGLITLEVYGHLGSLSRDRDKLYEAEQRAIVASLGLELPPGDPGRGTARTGASVSPPASGRPT